MNELTKSGIEVKIEPSTFQDAMQLKRNIEKALLKNNINIANIDIDLDKIKNKQIDLTLITPFLEIIMILDSDENVHNSIFKCLERCLYNKEKITIETFEPLEARADYYEVIFSCLKANLMPFFKTLFSELKEKQTNKKNESQK
jgi:hypothetical protein